MYYQYSKVGSQESHRQVCLARSTHEDTSFHISRRRRDCHFYVVIRATLWSSRWQGHRITFFLSIFKNLKIGPATTIVPATFHSVCNPTDWANPLNSITIGLYPSRSWWKTTERLQMPPISLSNLKPVRSTRRSISKETKLYLKFRCLGKLLSDLYEHDVKSKCMNSLVQSLELFKYTCQDNCRLTS